MEQFSKQIAVGNQIRLFEFTRLENVNGVKFFVTTTDENKKRISFSLTRSKEHSWRLLPGSLRWLYDIENLLVDAILDTQKNQSALTEQS